MTTTHNDTTPDSGPGLDAAITASHAVIAAVDSLTRMLRIDIKRVDPLTDVLADLALHDQALRHGFAALEEIVGQVLYRSQPWEDY